MIANITQGTYLKPLLNYNEKKIETGQAELLSTPNIFAGEGSRTLREAILQSHISGSRRKDKVIHISLNFPPEDFTHPLDDAAKNRMELIARDYLQNMGFEETHPSIIYLHTDKRHPHLHMVTSKVDAQGKCIPDAFLKEKSQRISRSLEEKYNLLQVPSVKMGRKAADPSQYIRYDSSMPLKKYLDGALNHVLNVSIPTRFDDLKNELGKFNIHVIEHTAHIRDGEGFPGLSYQYRGSGDPDTQIIKASAFHNVYTYKGLQRKFALNEQKQVGIRKQIKKELDAVFGFYETISPEKLRERLNKKNIDIVYMYDSNNQVKGVRFIDRAHNVSFSGEKVSKTYRGQNLAARLGESRLYPDKTTALNFNRYKDVFNHATPQQQVLYYLNMGFLPRIDPQNNQVTLNYFTNEKFHAQQGYIATAIKASDIDMKQVNKYFLENGLQDYSRFSQWASYHQALLEPNLDKAAVVGFQLFGETGPPPQGVADIINRMNAIIDRNTGGTSHNDPVETERKRKKRKKRPM